LGNRVLGRVVLCAALVAAAAARADDSPRDDADLAWRASIGVARYQESTFYELAYGVGASGYGPRQAATSLRFRENNGFLVKAIVTLVTLGVGTRTTYDPTKGETAEGVARQNREFQETMTSGGDFRLVTDLKLYSDKLGGQQAGFELREYLFVAHLGIPLHPELELGLKGGNVWGPQLRAPSDTTPDYSAGTLGLATLLRLQIFAPLEVFARFEPGFFGHTEGAVGATLSPLESFFVSGELQLSSGGKSLFGSAGVRL
jgi:hypothetical protein